MTREAFFPRPPVEGLRNLRDEEDFQVCFRKLPGPRRIRRGPNAFLCKGLCDLGGPEVFFRKALITSPRQNTLDSTAFSL